jgi:hypothetical protein
LRLPLLLGEGLLEQRTLLRIVLYRGRQREGVLSKVSASGSAGDVRSIAARVWKVRSVFELESAERFRTLVPQMSAAGASEAVLKLAREAFDDELRHAELCEGLAAHFGESVSARPAVAIRRVAPSQLAADDAALYEVIAMACVTETLSTALLGSLVEGARDSLAKQTMQSILRDEVNHSRLGWAFLAERNARGAPDCVSPHLGAMLDATLGDEFFTSRASPDPSETALAGLGVLDRPERRRIVCETLELVVFPGLERFGIDTALGRTWFRERTREPSS